jgi:hypothetical protein
MCGAWRRSASCRCGNGSDRLAISRSGLAVLIAASLCITAIARPQARLSSFRKASADIVILQDASASMYVTDVRPDRWRRSVQFLRTFAETLSWKGDRVALALFAQLAARRFG